MGLSPSASSLKKKKEKKKKGRRGKSIEDWLLFPSHLLTFNKFEKKQNPVQLVDIVYKLC